MDLIENLAFLVILVAWLLRAVLGPMMRRKLQNQQPGATATGPQAAAQQGASRPQGQGPKEQKPKRTAADILRELGLDPEAPPVQVPPPPPPAPTRAPGARRPAVGATAARGPLPPAPTRAPGTRAPGTRRPAAPAPESAQEGPPSEFIPPKPRSGLRSQPKAAQSRAGQGRMPRASIPLPPIPETAEGPSRPSPTRLRSSSLRKELLHDLRDGGRPSLQRAVLLAEVLAKAPGLKENFEPHFP
jgi:hypothetical protein